MVDCGLSFAKYSVFLFNFLFACAGIAMIAVGGVAHAKIATYNDFFDNYLTPFPILLIVVGCVIFAIAFLGCCGAIKENTCMLFLFSVILILIVAAEVAIVWTAFTKRDQVINFLDKRLDQTLRESRNKPEFSTSWDVMQREMKCCGINGPLDWTNATLPIPPACCNQPINSESCTVPLYNKGCKPALKEFVQSNVTLIAGIGIGLGVFQLLGIVFSCCLYSAFRRGHYY